MPKQTALTYDVVVQAFPIKDNRTELIKAVDENDLTKIKTLIKSGTDIHADDDHALRCAASHGHYDVVRLLLDKNANIHARDEHVLRCAALHGEYDVVKLLLDRDADIHAGDDSALRCAAYHGHYDVVKLLLDRGADIHAGNDYALRYSTENGDYDVVNLLLDNDADVHAGDDYTLRWAVLNGHYDVVKLLLDRDADMHVGDDYALSHATEKSYYDVVKLLLDNGANIHIDVNPALRWAAEKGHYDVVKLLLDRDADIHAGDDSALRYAAEKGRYDVVKLLLDNGANIHAVDDFPLRVAAKHNYTNVIKLLIDNGANIYADRDYPLRGAIANGRYDVAHLFVQQDPSLEKKYLIQNDEYTNYKTWQRLHNDFKGPKSLLDKNPHHFKLKTYLAVETMLNKEGYKGEVCAEYAYNISTLFRNEDRVLRYLQKWGEAGSQPLHDCAQFIKIPDAGSIDYKSWGDAVLSQGPKMARLVKFADRLAQPARSADGKGWSLNSTKEQAAQFVYKDATKHPKLAAACFDFNWDDDEFNDAVKQVKKYKKLFAANGMKKAQERIPNIKIDGADFGKPDYHFYKLPDGDMRGLLLGEFTNCCQHLANQGTDCAKHGFLSEQGGFYVIAHKKTDEIIGQSWAWRGEKEELVFDSLESLSGHFNVQNWERITSKFAAQISGNNTSQISALHIGKGGATPSLSFNKAAALAKPIDYNGYRDSENKQYLVAEFKPA